MGADDPRPGRTGSAIWRAGGRFVVAAWLAAGVALATVVVLESAVRLMANDAERSGSDSAGGRTAGSDTWHRVRDDQARRRSDLDPYRGEWSLPLQTPLVNIDSLGRRVTPQPDPGPAARQVLMLGGSEMWGVNAPDSATIPALVAAAMREGGVTGVEVVNLAQPRFVAMQGAMTLLTELAQGGAPKVVVFLSGADEIEIAARYGEPGRTDQEANYQEWLKLGRRPWAEEVRGLTRHSELLRVWRGHDRDGPAGVIPASDLCPAVAAHHRNLADALDALARTHGFTLLMFLAPPPSSRAPESGDGGNGAPPPSVLAACLAAMKTAMAGWGEGRFAALDPPLAGETGSGDDGRGLSPSAYERAAAALTPAIVHAIRAGDRSVPGGR